MLSADGLKGVDEAIPKISFLPCRKFDLRKMCAVLELKALAPYRITNRPKPRRARCVPDYQLCIPSKQAFRLESVKQRLFQKSGMSYPRIPLKKIFLVRLVALNLEYH